MEINVNKVNTSVYLTNFLIFMVLFPPAVPLFRSFVQLRALLVVVLLLFFIQNQKFSSFRKEQKYIFYALFGYVLFSTLSNIFAGYKSISSFMFNVLTPTAPLAMVYWCEYLKKKYSSISYNIVYIIFLAYILLNILTMIMVPEGFKEIEINPNPNIEEISGRTYFIGGKFIAAYFYIMFAAFFIYVSNISGIKKRIIMALFFAYAIGSSLDMKGMTAVGVLVFFAAFYFLNLPTKILRYPIIILGVIVSMSMVLLLFQEYLLQNELYLYFVEEVMGKDTHMTGRLNIYYRLSQYLLEHGGLIGAGTSYNFVEMIGASNLQNEMFQKLFQTGIGGVSCFFLYLYLNMKYARYDEHTRYWFVGLAALLFASLVEVPFEGPFMAFIAMMPKKYEISSVRT